MTSKNTSEDLLVVTTATTWVSRPLTAQSASQLHSGTVQLHAVLLQLHRAAVQRSFLAATSQLTRLCLICCQQMPRSIIMVVMSTRNVLPSQSQVCSLIESWYLCTAEEDFCIDKVHSVRAVTWHPIWGTLSQLRFNPFKIADNASCLDCWLC